MTMKIHNDDKQKVKMTIKFNMTIKKNEQEDKKN